MAQTFTLEQAAERLGISPEEFKRRLREEWKSVRSFRDGPTLRFRAADIDELARTLGEASDPGIPLGQGVPLTDSSEEIPITMPAAKPSGPQSSIIRKVPPPPKPPEPPLLLADDSTDEDIFSVPSGDSGVGTKGPKKASGDSDVRLDLTPGKSSASLGGAEVTEEISLDLPPPGKSGILKPGTSSGKLSNPKSAKLLGPESAKIPGPGSVASGDDGSSEFELSLDSDSDSFELTLNPDSSEEVDLGGMDTRGKPAGDPAGLSGIQRSGIRLNQPADQGVSLERNIEDDSDIDFELTLDAAGPASSIQRSGPLTGPKSGKKKLDDSDSEFELSLDDNSGVTDALVDDLNAEANRGDIFETDFELPVVSDEESGSEVVAIESSDTDLENSDFDIAIEDSDAPMDDESASQVVLVDDDAMPMDDDAMVLSDDDAQPLVSPSRKRKGLLAADDDDVMIGEVETEDGASASKALRGVKGRPAGDEDDTPIRSGVQPPARWGVIPALFLLPCLVVVVLGGLMMFEMIRGQWGYTQPSKPGDALVRGVAKSLDMKVTD